MKEYRENRKYSKEHNITKEEIDLIYEFSEYSCMYCGISEEEAVDKYRQKLHRDHAINNGTDGIENCILACKGCNSSKNSKDWDEWYLSSECFNEDRFMLIIEWLENFR